MRKIIVALDGSELSERSLGLGQELARSFTGELVLVHVLEEPVLLDLVPSLVVPDRAAAEQYLCDLAARVDGSVAVRAAVLRGNATAELLRLAEEEPEAILAMSTHGRGGLGRLMYGSVADKVLRAAPVPVALVRGTAPSGMTGLHNLLVPLDGSRLSEEVLPLAVDLTRQTGATLSLARVVEPFWHAPYVAYTPEAMYLDAEQLAEIETELLEDARGYLDQIAGELREQGVRVLWEVRLGRPADEIIRMAETTDADLLLLSTHGRGGIRRWALGSVTEEVLHRGITPLLVIPPKLRAREEAETAAMLSSGL
jgi:nucleotide-binding universal stress UspA family protein